MVYLRCNLCRGAATEPVLNRCGHLFCAPCLRTEFRRRRRRRRHRACRCPACGRCAFPTSLIPIYGQQTSSAPSHENGAACGLDDDAMDIDGAEAADDTAGAGAGVAMVDGSTEAEGGGLGGADPMDVDVDGDHHALEEKQEEEKMVQLECHICLEEAVEPVTTPCGHVYCSPCLFQWLDGRRRKCPVCLKLVSELDVTLVLATPGEGGEKRGGG